MDLVAEAKALVPAIGSDEAAAMMDQDNVLVVDVRDDTEVAQTGKINEALDIKGSWHKSRSS
jgi:rhodanese-related sulfurtransferase